MHKAQARTIIPGEPGTRQQNAPDNKAFIYIVRISSRYLWRRQANNMNLAIFSLQCLVLAVVFKSLYESIDNGFM